MRAEDYVGGTPPHIVGFASTLDAQKIAAVATNGDLTLYDTRTGRASASTNLAGLWWEAHLAYRHDGRQLLVGGSTSLGPSLVLLDATTLRTVATVVLPPSSPIAGVAFLDESRYGQFLCWGSDGLSVYGS